MSETREQQARELAEIIEAHMPLESCAGEPGDCGCSCGEKFSGEYTWKGYCSHLAGKLVRALAACALAEARQIKQELESVKEPTMLSAWTVAKSIVRERIAWHERSMTGNKLSPIAASEEKGSPSNKGIAGGKS